MLKKIMATVLVLAIAISMTACSSDGKKHMEIKNAQDAILTLDSGKISVLSQMEGSNKSDTIKSELIFRVNANGVMAYCQTQYDLNQKPVYCEYSNGEKTEQWLVGRGWSVLDTVQYTKEKPHRYNMLLATSFDKKAIDSIVCDEKDAVKTYTMELDPKILNSTTYKDAPIEVVSQSVALLVNEKSELVRYCDSSKIMDKESKQESSYSLEMTMSEQNAVSEVSRPELREYGDK